jgi:apolipoprotein D and lipocalin family protein
MPAWYNLFFDGDYEIVDTDYESYSVVYNCKDLLLSKLDYFSIYSRNKTLPQEKIDELVKLIERKFWIRKNKLKFTNQSDEVCTK